MVVTFSMLSMCAWARHEVSTTHLIACRDEVPVVKNTDFNKNYRSAVLFLTPKSMLLVLTVYDKKDIYQPHGIEDINTDHFIGNLDSDVWKAICGHIRCL